MRRIFVSIVLFLLSTGVSAAQPQGPQPGGTLNIGIHADLYGINPFIRMRSIDAHVRSVAYETLVALDAKGQIRPYLAESWSASADGKEYTFTLRRGVKFHTGQELTAEDVKWAVEYTRDPRHGATAITLLEDIETVRLPDRHKITFVLKRPSAGFLASLTTLAGLFAIPKDSIPMGQTEVQTMPPGTGPFVFKEWRAGSHVSFEKFKDYWQKGLPYPDRVVFKPVIEETARLAAVRAGDLDIANRIPSPWVLRVQKGEIKDFNLVPSRYAGFVRLSLNVVQPPFNNLKLRQAVAFALDRKAILEGAYWGLGEVTHERFPKNTPWHFDIPAKTRNLGKVKELLKEAGYKGEKITLITRPGQDEAPFVQAQLKEAGINFAVEILEAGTYRKRSRVGEFDMSFAGGESWSDPDPATVEFACDEEAVKRKQRDQNRSGYCNKEVDALFRQANSVTDYKKRFELYKKALLLVDSDAAEIPLLFEHRYFAVRPNVRDFTADGNQYFRWLDGGVHKTWLSK
ncbi:MAG: ABC transporter substrate-binding protein [Candidatus Binatia bacterium]